MGEDQNYFYEFGGYRLDPVEHQLMLDGQVIALTPKAFETLRLLVENAGHLLEKDRLMEMLWADAFVEEGNLADNVSKIRQALGDSRKDPKFIETVSGRGYRFIGAVERINVAAAPDQRAESYSLGATAEQFLGPRKAEQDGLDTTRANIDSLAGHRATVPLESSTSRKRFRAFAGVSAIFFIGAIVFFYLWSGNKPPAPSSAATRSMAVLPFRSLVASNRDEALELGMSDALISRLSRLRQLTVRPISAVRRYADLEQDALAAGRDLEVESVLDGTIQRMDDRIRLSARLVRVDDGTTLWSETFDEKFTDIFSVQDSISQKIVGALAVQLSREERDLLTKKYTDNTEAYQLYLKGRYYWNQLTPDGLQKSLDFYSQAIENDPNYALAYAGLADSYNLLGSYGFWQLEESHPKARAAAEKALALDEGLAEAHTSLAAVLDDYYWDWTAAEAHFEKAIQLNPNYPVARYWYSQHLSRMGRLDEAVDEARRAEALDPLSSSADAHVGLALYRARRFDEAAAELQKALQFNPDALDAHIFLGFVYVQQGKKQEAISELENVVELSGKSPSMRTLLGYAHASAGERDQALAILKEVDSRQNKQPVSKIETAMIYIALGDNDRAFELLNEAYERRAWQLGFLKVEPIFDPLRDDPRFADLMRRVNLAP